MNQESFERCLTWVRGREHARLCKEAALPPPYSSDPVIAKYRFCNVRREDDRVTLWIKENVRERFAGHRNLWFMLCVARQINWPDTLRELIETRYAWPEYDDFSPEIMGYTLQARADRGEKVFTGAYIITAPSTKGAKKTTFVAEETLGDLWDSRRNFENVFARDFDGPHVCAERTLRNVHRMLTDHGGWGPFLAYQAVVDMRFTPLLSGACDVRTWAAAGPGTIRGLNRIAGRQLDFKLSQDRALDEMRKLYPVMLEQTGVRMDFSDVPNVMCETDKYIRVLNGEGAPRALYIPGRGS